MELGPHFAWSEPASSTDEMGRERLQGSANMKPTPGGSWHRSGKMGNRLGWKEAVGNSWIALMGWVETRRWVK